MVSCFSPVYLDVNFEYSSTSEPIYVGFGGTYCTHMSVCRNEKLLFSLPDPSLKWKKQSKELCHTRV